ncbi:aminodeoxychorismate lyase [Cellvibrio sp. OA-2007]|uniref:aminodeoxychorismate lyase n=1 Tax=Cellvibrio sp. OA-2007 TaxID=529823 RepID=UPI000784C4A5|nr:aminodeoxychorismate lyase [Cellvibrio sp. OA-2007]
MPINFPLISVNGVLGATISPLDRGFAYGDGVFETCRYTNGSIPLWQCHRERLMRSAARLKIPLNEHLLNQYLASMMVQLSDANVSSAVVKITLTRGIGGRGYRLLDQIEPTYCVGVFSGSELQTEQYRNGVNVRICDLRLAQAPALAGMKHLNRLEHILARAEWRDEFAEGLLLDTQGRVIEATVSNLFAVKNNQLYTPDLSAAGVAGIMRQTILEKLAPALGLVCHVVDMDLNFLRAADEMFLCNSVYGIWPVNTLVDERQSTVVNQQSYTDDQITRALQQQLARLMGE